MGNEFIQTLQVGEMAMRALLLNENWVKSTLSTSSYPCVINEETGQLEHYIPNGIFYTNILNNKLCVYFHLHFCKTYF